MKENVIDLRATKSDREYQAWVADMLRLARPVVANGDDGSPLYELCKTIKEDLEKEIGRKNPC